MGQTVGIQLNYKSALVYWHFFKPITVIMGSDKLRTETMHNIPRKELVLVERLRSKVVLVMGEKTQIGQIV